ncbi:hypothetical protein U0070_027534 [Myodes glareolus]|uniref:Uncharacterized protein n=1 Tax=Myodes glareolus TaxID=447135 RepID=A0AAW0HGI3_MYOGA
MSCRLACATEQDLVSRNRRVEGSSSDTSEKCRLLDILGSSFVYPPPQALHTGVTVLISPGQFAQHDHNRLRDSTSVATCSCHLGIPWLVTLDGSCHCPQAVLGCCLGISEKRTEMRFRNSF